MACKPGGSHGRQCVERGPEGLRHQCEAMQHADSCQHMGRLGALLAPRCEPSPGATPLQQLVSQEGFGAPRQEPVAQCTQDRKVEARVRQLETQEILPVDTGADRLGGLTIGQVLAPLHERHEGQPPGGQPP